MTFTDKSLQCADCGATFTFSSQDQEFFQTKGYTNDPKRCPSCRNARKSERNGSNSSYGSRSQMYPATCSDCGKATEVPFQPSGNRPVYCSDCYRKVRVNR